MSYAELHAQWNRDADALFDEFWEAAGFDGWDFVVAEMCNMDGQRLRGDSPLSGADGGTLPNTSWPWLTRTL